MDKRHTLSSALDLLPERDFILALGGVTLYRRPLAFVLALLEQYARVGRPSELTLLSFTAGLESDLLVGAGLIKRVRTCYFGLEAFGLAPHFTNAAAEGRIEIMEETEASLAYGIRASMAGVGFMPSTAWQGTDLLKLRPDVQCVRDPYSGEELTAFPAIHPDVAILHVLQSDPQGNATLGGNRGIDFELALIAETVILTAEEIVPKLAQAEVFGPRVKAVVEAPGGAWPSSCHPKYPLDGLALLDYIDRAGSETEPALLEDWRRHAELQRSA